MDEKIDFEPLNVDISQSCVLLTPVLVVIHKHNKTKQNNTDVEMMLGYGDMEVLKSLFV